MTSSIECCCDLPLRSFTIHVRSFHPEPSFGIAGLGYHGDNRGYSNVPRSLKERGKGVAPTSRVEHWVEFNADTATIMRAGAASDPSQWLLGEKHRYDGSDGRAPTVEVLLHNDTTPGDQCRRQIRVQSHHLGYNEAVPQLTRGLVPGLDVFGVFIIQIDRRARTMTITTHITGDAFPNAEAFIVDTRGTSVFLGVHERQGTPPAMLPGEEKRFMFSSSLTLALTDAGDFAGTLTAHRYKTKDVPGTIGDISSQNLTVKEWNQSFIDKPPSTPERRNLDNNLPYLPDIYDKVFEILRDLYLPSPAY